MVVVVVVRRRILSWLPPRPWLVSVAVVAVVAVAVWLMT